MARVARGDGVRVASGVKHTGRFAHAHAWPELSRLTMLTRGPIRVNMPVLPNLTTPDRCGRARAIGNGVDMPRLNRRRFVTHGALAGAVFTPAFESHEVAPFASPALDVGQDRSTVTTEKPDELVRRLMNGFQLTQLIYIAAKLKIADQLAQGPRAITDLAAVTNSHEESLYRILRTLAGLGVFREEDGRRFRLTPAAEILRSGVPGSLRASAESRGEDWTWRAWGALRESVKTGKTGFDVVYGKNTFDWFAENPEAARLFDEFQANNTSRSAADVVTAYDFSRAMVVVDVGGGNGTLLSEVLRRHTAPRGILFDLPHVVEAAKPVVAAALAPRIQYVGGDFFKAVPEGGDVYILKYILHDWEETRARNILSSCHRAMSSNAKLLVIEDIVCGPNIPCQAKLSDIQMLARTGAGTERNRSTANCWAPEGLTRVVCFLLLPVSP